MTAEQTIQEIADEFALVGGWEERYAHIIAMGKMLSPFPEEFRSEEYRVKGCTSQVWLHPRFENGKLQFDAESDAIIVKGLVALLMRIFNNRKPSEILAINLAFIHTLGLDTHLSPSRANGLTSMVKDIIRYATLAQHEHPETHTDEPEVSEEVAALTGGLRDSVIEAIHTVFDPEIPIDIYELGLIYEVRVSASNHAHILMTLTTPNCPSAQSLPLEVEEVVRNVPGVSGVDVEITFDPPWDKTMMSEAALFSIGLF